MFYTGNPELRAIERRNLQLRSATFAAAFRLLARAGRHLANLPGTQRIPSPTPAPQASGCATVAKRIGNRRPSCEAAATTAHP